MRFNDREIRHSSAKIADKEGRLLVKTSKGPKELWFKLCGNLLYYYKLNLHGGVSHAEPVGVYVLENCQIETEVIDSTMNSFSIRFLDEIDKKHLFTAANGPQCEAWVQSLRSSSYECLRERLKFLQKKLLFRTGMDPLQGKLQPVRTVTNPPKKSQFYC